MRHPRQATNITIAAIVLLVAFMIGVYTDSTVAVIPIIYIRTWLENALHLSQEAAIFFTFMSPTLYSILFCLWNINLFHYEPTIARRSKIAYMLTAAGCVYWYLSYGRHPSGQFDPDKAFYLLLSNLCFFVVLAFILYLNRKESTFMRALLFNFTLFAWIMISAFPWYFPTF
jgi:hypothetical protein